MNKERQRSDESNGAKTDLKVLGYQETPTVPDEVVELLPILIFGVIRQYKDRRRRDIALLSILTAVSSATPNVFGFYFGKRIEANLFSIIGAPPAFGKGEMMIGEIILKPIHDWKMEKCCKENEAREKEWEVNKEGTPPLPIVTPHFFPADNTSAGHVQLAADCKEGGMVVDYETDGLRIIFDGSYGWSDLLRKTYHHEPIRVFRKGDRIYKEIRFPKLSVLLSGTPEQISSFIKSPENGLFSRFCFYVFKGKAVFVSPWSNEHSEINESISELSRAFFSIYLELTGSEEKEFKFTDDQKRRFDEKFPEKLDSFQENVGTEGVGVVFRLGLIFFRLSMILTLLRDHKRAILMCDDRDFEVASKIVDVLSQHSLAVMSTFIEEAQTHASNFTPKSLLENLPNSFTTKTEVVKQATIRKISKRTVFRYIEQLVSSGDLIKVRHGQYEKRIKTN